MVNIFGSFRLVSTSKLSTLSLGLKGLIGSNRSAFTTMSVLYVRSSNSSPMTLTHEPMSMS